MEGTGGTVGAEVPEVGEGQESSSIHVMVAIDDSDESFNALQWVIDKILSRQPSSSSSDQQADPKSKVATLVHVMEPLPRYAFPGGYVVESASKAQEQNGARILSRAYEMCRDKSVNAKTLILEGDPKDSICRAVEQMNINLLVVGSRGLGQIKRAFLGSASDYCAHHAKCPVLVVKPTLKKKA